MSKTTELINELNNLREELIDAQKQLKAAKLLVENIMADIAKVSKELGK